MKAKLLKLWQKQPQNNENVLIDDEKEKIRPSPFILCEVLISKLKCHPNLMAVGVIFHTAAKL
jgi:hypothetical protein